MVTAEINSGNPEENQEYPCTMISKDTGLIVGFKGHGKGTIIAPGKTDCNIYDYSEHWDMNFFIPFSGSVTLRNS